MPAHRSADATPMSDVDADLAGNASLRFTDGEGRERSYPLEGLESVSIGRRTSCDIALPWDDQVSRLHARLERTHNAWELVDDGFSSNGTFVNDQRLGGKRRLADGDVLRFGATSITFCHPRPTPRPVKAPATPTIEVSSTQRRVLAALCRPYKGGNSFASPATDEQIAEALVMSTAEVRTHLKILCAKLAVDPLTTHATRVRLVERAFAAGVISEREL